MGRRHGKHSRRRALFGYGTTGRAGQTGHLIPISVQHLAFTALAGISLACGRPTFGQRDAVIGDCTVNGSHAPLAIKCSIKSESGDACVFVSRRFAPSFAAPFAANSD
jgi:hypothetical protein